MAPHLATLFAQAPQPGDPTAAVIRDPRTALAAGLLVAVLLAGAAALFLLDRWRRRQFADVDAAQESAESLSSFRALYERGELSEEEYQKVRAKMAAKIKRDVVASQPSLGKSVTRPTATEAGPNGPTDRGDFAPGDGPATGPRPGSPDS